MIFFFFVTIILQSYSDADIILSKDWVPPITIAPAQVTPTHEGESPARKKTSSVSFSLDSTTEPGTPPLSSSVPDGKDMESRKNKVLIVLKVRIV